MSYTVSQFKEVLDGFGYNLGPDGLNGNQGNSLDVFTQAAIQEFQKDYALPTTGQLDAATIILTQKLVRSIQYNLNLVVHAKLPISKFYGPRVM